MLVLFSQQCEVYILSCYQPTRLLFAFFGLSLTCLILCEFHVQLSVTTNHGGVCLYSLTADYVHATLYAANAVVV